MLPATIGITSCSDSFLDEKLITEKGAQYFQTKDGLDDLVILENYIPQGMIGDQKKLDGGGE